LEQFLLIFTQSLFLGAKNQLPFRSFTRSNEKKPMLIFSLKKRLCENEQTTQKQSYYRQTLMVFS